MSERLSSQLPHLIIIRAPAGTGKSTIASLYIKLWREQYPTQPIAYVEQDYFRNVLTGGQAGCRELSATLILQTTKSCLDAGYHVVLEGILNVRYYQKMLQELIDYCGREHSHIYYLNAALELTKERHQTRQKAGVFGDDCLSEWYSSASPLSDAKEEILEAVDFTAQQVVDKIMIDVHRS